MKKLLSAFVFFTLLLVGCKPEAYKEIGQPSNKLQAMTGNWKLVQVIQNDLVAQNYGYQDPSRPDVNLISMDVTNVAPFTNFSMTLNFTNTAKGTFTTTPGTAPKIIRLASGNVDVDNATTPSKLAFSSNADTVRMDIGNYTSLANNMLTLSLTRYQGTKPVIRYDYKFAKN